MIVWIQYQDGMKKGYTAYVRDRDDLIKKLDRLNIRADNTLSFKIKRDGEIRELDPAELNKL